MCTVVRSQHRVVRQGTRQLCVRTYVGCDVHGKHCVLMRLCWNSVDEEERMVREGWVRAGMSVNFTQALEV